MDSAASLHVLMKQAIILDSVYQKPILSIM